MTDAPALRLLGVHKAFGSTQVIRGVSLSVEPGERHLIIGPNGTGKTTLFNLISGRLSPTSGEIWLHGRRVDGRRPHELARLGLSRSFQISNIFPKMTTHENVRCALFWPMGMRYCFWRRVEWLDDVNARTTAILEAIGLSSYAGIVAGELSYADQRSLELGVTLASGASVVLLDEPTAGMSVAEAKRMVALIRRVTAGKTLIAVEHNMDVVFDLADRISVLVFGEVLRTGRPEEVRADPVVRSAYLGDQGK